MKSTANVKIPNAAKVPKGIAFEDPMYQLKKFKKNTITKIRPGGIIDVLKKYC